MTSLYKLAEQCLPYVFAGQDGLAIGDEIVHNDGIVPLPPHTVAILSEESLRNLRNRTHDDDTVDADVEAVYELLCHAIRSQMSDIQINVDVTDPSVCDLRYAMPVDIRFKTVDGKTAGFGSAQVGIRESNIGSAVASGAHSSYFDIWAEEYDQICIGGWVEARVDEIVNYTLHAKLFNAWRDGPSRDQCDVNDIDREVGSYVLVYGDPVAGEAEDVKIGISRRCGFWWVTSDSASGVDIYNLPQDRFYMEAEALDAAASFISDEGGEFDSAADLIEDAIKGYVDAHLTDIGRYGVAYSDPTSGPTSGNHPRLVDRFDNKRAALLAADQDNAKLQRKVKGAIPVYIAIELLEDGRAIQLDDEYGEGSTFTLSME